MDRSDLADRRLLGSQGAVGNGQLPGNRHRKGDWQRPDHGLLCQFRRGRIGSRRILFGISGAVVVGEIDCAELDRTSASFAALAEFNSKTARTHSGIYRDIAVRKRKTEVDPQIGVIAELGAEAGIETQAIRRLVALNHDIEDGQQPMSINTFRHLTAP